jgi:gamma-glutamyltranspeptidase/glutathione hydrolase
MIEAAGPAARENVSPHAVTIPGAVSGWQLLLDAHGTKGFDELLQPAIRCAEDGFPVHSRVAWDWSLQVEKLSRAGNKLFLPGGRAPQEGQIFVQTALAGTLRAIAARGADAFYTGPVAADMAATLKSAGGVQTEEDFANGRFGAEFVEPIRLSWRGLDVWQCPPNGPGITMLVMLNILSRFDLTKFPAMSVERFHLEAEAARVAYMMREQRIGDPSHVEVDVAGILKEFADEYAPKIRMDRMLDLPKVSPPMNPSTVYITVVDKDRNVCSFINSIAHSFGSAIVSNKTGVLLQNRGAGFRIQPGHPNCIAPGKRPLHTIIPSLATKSGRAVMPFGVMGGQYQPVGQCHVLTNMLDYGCDVQEAIDMPRGLHYENVYQLEDGVPAAIVEGLKQLGHQTTSVVPPLGGAQAIWIDWDKGTLTGGSDPRKDGCALGY